MNNVEIVRPPAAKVDLIAMTPDPRQVIGMLSRGYEHEYSSEPVSLEYADRAIRETQLTALQGAFEMVHMVWLLRGVSRAFTAQLERYRIGTSYIQESLRFSKQTQARVLDTTGGQPEYSETVNRAFDTYWELINRGIPIEDARGLLPLNTLTSVFFSCSFRSLVNIWQQRACTQAQAQEWPVVLAQMRDHLMGSGLERALVLNCQNGGPCLFRSQWDRSCAIREGLEER